MPPAFVDRFPPIWHEPSEPRLSGNNRSAAVRSGLYVGKDAARFDRDRVVERLDLANAAHALERQHDLRAARIRRRSAAIARVAAVRNDSDPVLGTDADDARDLSGAVRQDDERSPAGEEAAEIVNEGLDLLGLLDHSRPR